MPRLTMRLTLLLWLLVTGSVIAQVDSKEEDIARRVASLPESDREAAVLRESGISLSAVARSLITESDKYRDKGEHQEALALLLLSKKLAERERDEVVVGTALDRIGVVHFRRDEYPLALEALRDAMVLRQKIGDRRAIAESLDNTGKVYQWQEEFPKAIELYKESLELSTQLGDQKGQARTLQNLGSLHSVRGDLREAEHNFSLSLQIKQRIGDNEGVAITSNSLSGIAHSRGDYIGALRHLETALSIFVFLNQLQRANVVRGNMALIHTQLGNYDQALELTAQSLAMAEKAGNRLGISSELDRIGSIHFYRGDMARALEYYQRALAEAEAVGVKGEIGIKLQNIAGVHDWQGNSELALVYFERALVMRRAAENKVGIADLLNRIGRIYLQQGDVAQARAKFEESLKANEDLDSKEGVADVRLSLGDMYLETGDLGAARTEFETALRIHEEIGNRRSVISNQSRLAALALRQTDYPRALKAAEAAIALANEINTQVGLPEAHTSAGRALRALGEPAAARRHFERAIEVIERLRIQAAGAERDQQTLFSELIAPYHEMVDLLVGQNKLSEALEFSERARGRVLLDVLSTGKSDVGSSMTLDEFRNERQLANNQTSLNAQLTKEMSQSKRNEAAISDLQKRLAAARSSYEDFETQLYTKHPELRRRRGIARVVDLKQSGEMIRDNGTALLEYVVKDNGVHLFVMTRGANSTATDLRAFPIAATRSELAKQVDAFRKAIEERDVGFAPSALKLHELLLGPARSILRGKSRLVIVPDDSLWSLPFQALQTSPGKYLLEQASISYAPSLSVLREIERQVETGRSSRVGNDTLLAVGNPFLGEQTMARAKVAFRDGGSLQPLPAAEREARSLSSLYDAGGTHVYTGRDASEARVKAEAREFRILHFATHGIFNDASPMYSNIVLAEGDGEDGLLEAWELAKLDLKADLVVLSACETGRGSVRAGEGLIGLSWALFVAGCPTTVVSQWKVASVATQKLMLDFHRQLRAPSTSTRSQLGKAQGLRLASLNALKDPARRHPFYWAAFVVVGDGR